MKGYKVLIDVNILVSSSIYYVSKDLGLTIKHRFYDECKTLINFFKANVDKKIGFYTKSIDRTANRVLKEAVISTIEEISEPNPKGTKEKLFEMMSIIFSESLRRLEDNKDCLIKETINEEKVSKQMTPIYSFFNDLAREIEKLNPKPAIQRLNEKEAHTPLGRTWKYVQKVQVRRDFPHYNILHNKFIQSNPGREDMELLAQSIYFKELYAKEDINFFLVSTDYHLIEIDRDGIVNDFVPKRIKETFGVECLRPGKLLKIIK